MMRTRLFGLALKLPPIGFLAGIALALLPASTHAESAKVAAGEYAPFVTQQLPEDGVTAAIITAALKTQGVNVSYDFLPWKRGYYEAELGKYIGTFPYLKTAERELAFLYSEPIYADQFRLFVRKSEEKERGWLNKSVCIPLGYDTSKIEKFTTENKMTLERPSEITNCFNMLDAGRVDAVWASELVGAETAKTLFGKNSRVHPLDLILEGNTKYYFIVSKRVPDADKWLARFNTGLKQIQKDGTYKKILVRFGTN